MTDAVALAEPDAAVIVAEPSATEVTRPEEETVAIPASVVVHVTVGLGITVPPASLTVGTSVAVSPTDAKLRLDGESVIEPAA